MTSDSIHPPPLTKNTSLFNSYFTHTYSKFSYLFTEMLIGYYSLRSIKIGLLRDGGSSR